MAKQIKRSEIAQEDLYKDIRDSAEKTIVNINELNDSLAQTATVIKTELQKPLKVTIDGINSVNTSVNIMNETMEASIKLDKAKADAIKTQIDAETKLEKLEQERIKTQIQENKLAQEEIKLKDKQNKQDKQSEKQKQKNVALTREEIKEKLRSQKISQALKKELQDELILQDDNAGTLEKLSAKSRQLRREREKLNLETEEGRKRLKEINEELDDNNEVIRENSDALKKQKLNVGNYTESIQEATGELGGMIKGIKDSIEGIKDQAKAFMIQAKSADTAGKKIRLIGKAIKASGIGLLIAMLGSVVSALGDTRAGVLAMQGTMQKTQAFITMIGNKIMDTFEKIKIRVQLAMLSLDKFKMAIMDLTIPFTDKKPFEGLFDIDTEKTKKEIGELENRLNILSKKEYKLGDIVENIDKTIKKGFEYEDLIASLSDKIEKLRGEEELLSEQAGDMTLSFDKQRKAQKEYNDTVEERIGLEKDLALANVDLQALKIKQRLIDAGMQYNDEQIKNLDFLKDEEARMIINSDELAQLSDAKRELIAIDNELASAQAKNAMEARNTAKDDFEKQLDYAIDAFDIQKTINERIINNEKSTLAQRDALTEETRRLADSAFANQVKLVQDYTKQRIDFDKLLKMTDEEEIRRTLKKFDLNETTLTRILEILKERKIVNQDLADIEDETAKKRIENNQAIAESIQNEGQENFDFTIELMEKAFDEEKKLRDKSLQDEKVKGAESIDELKQRLNKIRDERKKQLMIQASFERLEIRNSIMEEDQKAQKIEEINNKLQNDIIRVENETADKKKELDEQEIQNEEDKAEKLADIEQQRAEDRIAVAQALTDAHNDFVDRRIAKIDEEIEASQKRFDNLQDLANQGNILAKESLAEEAKLIAEQTRRREQLERRKQRVQLASTVLQTYLKNSSDPEVEKPLQKTITDTVLLTEFIKSLPALFEGTENTGTHGQGLDGKGGFLSVLHPNERVVPKKNNDMIGNMSNDDLAQLAYNYQNGLLRDVTDGVTVSNSVSGVDVLAKKLDSLERTISNKPEHNIELEQIIDGAMAITRRTKQGNTKIFNRYRVS